MYQIAGERLLGKSVEGYTNGNMQRGQELEAEAREAYEIITSQEVRQVGFCLSDNGLYGVSPDGLIGDEGGLEIKCPTLPVHILYLLENKLPTDYIQQVQGQLLVTGRKWVDFFSYFPGIKPLIVRVYPDKEFIKMLRVELEVFCIQLKEVVEKLK
jgi:predicted phage-related endonuclease